MNPQIDGACSANEESASPLPFVLARAAEACIALWPDRDSHRSRLVGLQRRLSEQRFHLAVLGQFKRGKSSFLNAVLGAPLLPTAIVPLTAIPTFIQWGEIPRVQVSYRSDARTDDLHVVAADVQSTLFRFVTEEANPRNHLGIARVDLFYPAPFLRNGITLIDTPGIGSTLRHNTDAALQILPECDAALLVLSPDPPTTEAELAYLQRIESKVVRLFIILNKIDIVADGDRATLEKFIDRTLNDHAPAASHAAILRVSATQALAAKQMGDADLLARSGFGRVERQLVEFLQTEKLAALHEAIAHKVATLLSQAEMDAGLEARALEMPIEELDRRMPKFTAALAETERQKIVAQDLMYGDLRRLTEKLENTMSKVRRQLIRTLLDAVERVVDHAGADAEKEAMKATEEMIPELFDGKLGEVLQALRSDTDDLFADYQKRAGELIDSVRRAAADIFEVPMAVAAEPEPLTITREPYWVAQGWDQGLSPVSAAGLDRLLPASYRHARLKRRLARQVEDLVCRNVENLRWAALQSLNDTFRRFGNQLEEQLDRSIEATRDAIQAAIEQRKQRSELSIAVLQRLRTGAATLRRLRGELEAAGAKARDPGSRSGPAAGTQSHLSTS